MKQLTALITAFTALVMVTACSTNTKANDAGIIIRDWDNSKYEEMAEYFKYSIGLNVYNENSFERIESGGTMLYKELETLFVSNIERPVTLRFNSNGRDRNFIITVFYDYEQTPFKITDDGQWGESYQFDLGGGKEIELPLYLPSGIKTEGVHKLIISFIIGHDLKAADQLEPLTWYGMNQSFDVIYNADDMDTGFPEKMSVKYLDNNTVDLVYDFTINRDGTFDILKTGILKPMDNLIEAEKGKEILFTYNVPGANAENALIVLTANFKQIPINNARYELCHVPEGTTAISEMRFTAPEEAGDYEIIAYLVYNPFSRHAQYIRNIVDVSQRFTLRVR